MLVHLLAAVAVLLIALMLGLTLLEFALLALAITLVLFAELINTALEVVVDLVSPEYHPLARRAKDVAAGAVLVASVGAVIMGYLALSRFFFPPDMHESPEFLRSSGNLAMVRGTGGLAGRPAQGPSRPRHPAAWRHAERPCRRGLFDRHLGGFCRAGPAVAGLGLVAGGPGGSEPGPAGRAQLRRGSGRWPARRRGDAGCAFVVRLKAGKVTSAKQ
jgi:diacylglycerol kinase